METNCPICNKEMHPTQVAPFMFLRCSECLWIDFPSELKLERHKLDRDELLKLVNKAGECVQFAPSEKVLDINSGDGILLGWYTKHVVTVGVEQDILLMKEALENKRIDVPVPQAFSASAVQETCEKLNISNVHFKIITAINVMPTMQLLADCFTLLHPQGVFVLQVPYLPGMKAPGIGYTTVGLKKAMEKIGFTVQGVEFPAEEKHKDIIRVYASDPSFRLFAAQNVDNKIRMYMSLTSAMVQEMRKRYDTDAPYENLVPQKQESRNAF